LREGRVGLDVDLLRFQGLGNLANEIDRQETVLQIGAIHPDMIGKLEPVFERAAGNAAMQITFRGRLLLLAGYGQQVGLEGDIEIALLETRYRDRDAIAVIAGLDDVLGRPVADRAGALGVFEEIEDPVEADARAEKRCVVVRCCHSHILLEATWVRKRRKAALPASPAPSSAAGGNRFGF